MKTALRIIGILVYFGFLPCIAADQAKVHLIRFPVSESASLGQIDKIVVKVSCSWIAAMENVPELYNIEMGYDTPAEYVFEARPRLGAGAVELPSWSGVIGIRVPHNADAKSCFAVDVSVEGRSGVMRHWKGSQLGIAK